jgi:hypothetical protein
MRLRQASKGRRRHTIAFDVDRFIGFAWAGGRSNPDSATGFFEFGCVVIRLPMDDR